MARIARVRFPRWIKTIYAVVYLVYRARIVLMHIQMISISPGNAPITAFLKLHQYQLGTTELPSAEIGLVNLFTKVIVWRLTTTEKKISCQHYTDEFLPEVYSGLFIF